MRKSVAVLGLGKYGRSLAENLYKLGADVLVVDKDERIINEMTSKCTSAICADLSNEDEVMVLGLKNMDVVVAAMGGELAASIMVVSVAREQGVPVVVAKSSSERMSAILRKVGVDKIIDPESEGGSRSAKILLSNSFRDVFELDDNMYMIEMEPKKEWIGKSLRELELRKKMSLNVVAVKERGAHWTFVDPGDVFEASNILLVVMEKKDMKI
ncbi:MAG: TrkA family potassium uptake protein [Lachnospiraceae bacterium]|nr:TrkA family potassium uptake protein [Lachnospiraceae bacterium]